MLKETFRAQAPGGMPDLTPDLIFSIDRAARDKSALQKDHIRRI